MAASTTGFADQLDDVEEAKSADGCCSIWIQDAGRQIAVIQNPHRTFFMGQFIGRESRCVTFIPSSINQESPEERRAELSELTVGFLNTNEGGTVFCGVSEEGELTGLVSKEETRLKSDVDVVFKNICNADHNFHHSLHFYRIYRYNRRQRRRDQDSTDPFVADPRPLPPLTERILGVLKVSNCRCFPSVPYTSNLLDPTVTFVRRDGSCSPISTEFYNTEEKWLEAHGSLCHEQQEEAYRKNFATLARLKNAIFELSDKLARYETLID